MNPQKLEMISRLFSCNPVVSTDHVARYFTDRGSPNKRASEYLLELEKQKLIEGRRRMMGESKVWRLTKKGRESAGVKSFPVPLNSNKVNHFLLIASVWQDLRRMGELKKWSVELREPFTYQGKKMTFCPDAFFVLATPKGARAYLLEVQSSPLTTNRWAEKWAINSAFQESPEYKTASFQIVPNKVITPQLIVISTQQKETIQGGSRLPLLILPDIKKLPLV